MKPSASLWFILAFACSLSLAACQPVSEELKEGNDPVSPTIFYIIRHAEKEAAGDNPGLSAKGNERALLLAEMFEASPLDAIYSTPFLRNTSTVKPLALSKNIEISIYDPSDSPGLLKQIFEKHPGGNVLIVGHSNTVPGIVNSLLWEEKFGNLSETEYSRLFIVAASAKERGTYSEVYFGPADGR